VHDAVTIIMSTRAYVLKLMACAVADASYELMMLMRFFLTGGVCADAHATVLCFELPALLLPVCTRWCVHVLNGCETNETCTMRACMGHA
jgi:hypothetical protein